MTETTVPPDPRPAWLRALVWLGIVVVAAIGPPLVAVGLLGLGTGLGRALLCLGLVLTVSLVAGVAREVAERRHRQQPPQARLVTTPGGERALFLPRAEAPTRIASLALLGYAAVSALGALWTLLAGDWGWALALLLLAAYLAHLAAPHRGSLAGGLWLGPTQLVHEHQGIRWRVDWGDVTGVVPQQTMPVLVRPDRTPTVERTGPRGRGWRPRPGSGVLAVDTRHLAGGPTLASYVVAKAVTDPASRAVLGTSDSLPPERVGRPSGGSV